MRGQAPVEREEPRDVVDCDDLGRRRSGPQKKGMVFDEADFRSRRLLLSDLVVVVVFGLSASAPYPPHLEPAFLLQGVAANSGGCQPK